MIPRAPSAPWAGYAYVPYSSLESVIEQSKEAYYVALRQTQGTIRNTLKQHFRSLVERGSGRGDLNMKNYTQTSKQFANYMMVLIQGESQRSN